MNNLLDQPLSQIVLKNFETANILENNGLDFCCRGKRTLRTACAEKGISTDDVLNELNFVLNKKDQSLDFQHMSLGTLSDYIIETHHSYVKNSLPQISGYLFKIATRHGENFPHMKRVFVLFTQVKTELEAHLLKEEEVVFPAIKRMEQDGAATVITHLNESIQLMESEHEMAGSLMEKIRHLTNNYEIPPNACTTFQVALNALSAFETDLHKHVHLENNILFPKAIAYFQNMQEAIRRQHHACPSSSSSL